MARVFSSGLFLCPELTVRQGLNLALNDQAEKNFHGHYEIQQSLSIFTVLNPIT
jgi:hypothetical protein